MIVLKFPRIQPRYSRERDERRWPDCILSLLSNLETYEYATRQLSQLRFLITEISVGNTQFKFTVKLFQINFTQTAIINECLRK